MSIKSIRSIVFLALLAFALAFSGGCSCGDDDDDDTSADDDDTAADDDADDDTGDDDDDDDDDDDTSADDDDTSDDDDFDDDLDDDLPVDNPAQYVDPLIGTGGWIYGMGALNPGPMLPNAPVKLGPDTSINDLIITKMHAGGYYYYDGWIRGFSHTHLPGTGVTDLANVNLMPVLGISDERITDAGYRSKYDHATEVARPGYYKVTLERFGIDVELTSTINAGVHRYTFPTGGGDPHVVIDATFANDPSATGEAEITIDTGAGEVFGMTDMRQGFTGRTDGLPTYFVVRFSETIASHGTFANDVRDPGGTTESGADCGAYVGFAPGTTSVTAKVGISFISVEKARENLNAQMTLFDFDGTESDAVDAWNDILSDVIVYGGDDVTRTVFYTALYHLYVLPTSFTEEGGEYRGFDRAVHTATGFTYYTDFSLWDTYRTLHPAMALLRPEIALDFVHSLMAMNDEGGSYPRWAAGLGDAGSMIGTHSDSVIAEALVKGIDGFDVQEAYDGLRLHAVGDVPYGGRSGLDEYMLLGWVPSDVTSGSVSKTQEYAYDDFCLAQMADHLGETADRDLFMDRAGNYANLWDPATKHFRGRDSIGDFTPEPFAEWWLWYEEYTEGNARHWRWYAPHDVPGLVDLFGGVDDFVSELDAFFTATLDEVWMILPDLHYYHGNEPDIHAAYLFSAAGRPDLAAKWARWIMTTHYDETPDGIYGNDDGGTLSAWYVFSALGLYPIAPCSPYYFIGSPIFPRADVRVGPGKTLSIVAENTSDTNIYVQSATLNDEPLTEPWIAHADVAAGGELRFVMGASPSSWGQGEMFE
ncbi:GH92 family glycosyl hydrolase [bacterium]|nr:GH92 family glycosyl hydrolase [bacterium]